MNGHKRNKARLLSRVSTLAIISAAGTFGAAHQAQAACYSTFNPPATVGNVTVASPFTCVVIDEPVTGNVTSDAPVGNPGPGYTPFLVTADIGGQLFIGDNITGGYYENYYEYEYGYEEERGALTIAGEATIGLGIFNDAAITSESGNGIQIGIGGENGGYILNGITNADAISSGSRYGIAALYGSLSGGLTNEINGTINGGLAGVYIADTFGAWDGGISNFGQIKGSYAAIRLGDGDDYSEGSLVFSGGITNQTSGIIDSNNGPAIIITNDVATFNGGIHNFNDIQGGDSAIVIQAVNFNGGMENGDLAQIIANGPYGDAIYAYTNWTGNFDNQGLIQSLAGNGFAFYGSSYNGNFANSDIIFGGKNGVIFDNYELTIGDSEVPAEFVNSGTITGEEDVGLYINADTFDGSITNHGQIIGGGSIEGAGVSVFSQTWTGNFTNSQTGSIDGGVLIGGVTFDGDFSNAGSISHSYLGPQFVPELEGDAVRIVSSFVGNFTNTGSIEGGEAGVWIDPLEGNNPLGTFTGNFLNSGLIDGEVGNGANIEVYGFYGNFTNESGGTISGGSTGAYIESTIFTGQIVNNGQITGGAFDSGLHIVTTGTHTGDIVNNGTLSAPGNALHVEIGTLIGGIINTGTIQANTGATAVLLEIDDDTASFTNTDGGVILGNVALNDAFFGGKTAYTFYAEDGGLEGSLTGAQDCIEGCVNNDYVVVRDGTHYFVDGGGENGTAGNLAAFTVADGGTAIMGALFVGDTGDNAIGYSFSNVDALNVNNGGTLYIDNATTLNVDNSYTQQSGGTLMFYLGAPGGEGFSDLTGTQVAGPDDYGQIIVTGPATLDGTIAAFLDPAFGSANPGLTQVQYNDVIVATGGIVGDFDFTALISNNSLFELDSVIDGNTVDLHVLRAPLGEVATVSSIVNTGDPFDANIAERTGGIGGGCGVAGGGWCRNRYAAAEPGATQVMTDATPGEDPFDWLRAGTRRIGETAVWGRGVGSWGETDGDVLIPGSEYSLGGLIAGVDHVFAQTLLAGAAVQWTTTDVEFGAASGDAEVDSLEVGAYASLGDPRLYLNANVSYIWHNFEVNRVVGANRATGDYDGDTISAYLEAGKTFQTDGGLRIQPLAALSYAHVETDAYSETGTGTLLNVLEAELDSLKGVVGVRGAYPFALESGRKLITEVRVAWAHEFMDDHSSHFSDVQGGAFNPQLVTGEEFSRDTLVLGTGITVPLSETTTVFVDYDAGLNADITTHTVSAGLRTRW